MPPIDVRWLIRAGLALALVVLGFLSGHGLRGMKADRDLAECQRTHAQALAITMRAAQQAENDYRARELAWMDERERISQDANAELSVARRDADRLRAALDRLRRSQATPPGGSDAPANPGAAPGSEATGTPGALPSDLLIRLGEAAGELARHADEARIAGTACQRAYQTLTTPRLGAPSQDKRRAELGE